MIQTARGHSRKINNLNGSVDLCSFLSIHSIHVYLLNNLPLQENTFFFSITIYYKSIFDEYCGTKTVSFSAYKTCRVQEAHGEFSPNRIKMIQGWLKFFRLWFSLYLLCRSTEVPNEKLRAWEFSVSCFVGWSWITVSVSLAVETAEKNVFYLSVIFYLSLMPCLMYLNEIYQSENLQHLTEFSGPPFSQVLKS